jgi:large subunit ribosomal protein L2
MIKEILAENKAPMSRDQIIEEVLKRRLVKKNTILVGLSNKKMFEKVGSTVMAGENAEIAAGNRLALANIPVGTLIHDIELIAGRGGRIARSAGSYCILQTVEAGYALLKMPSGEIRKVRDTVMASIGQLANSDWMNVRIGKAGRKRHMGWRPQVRGKVMNPVDHPHGGGEGRNPIGLKYPKTPWGKHALGVKTRKPKKYSLP